MALPAGGTDHQVTHFKLGVARLFDTADSAAGHYLADFHWSGVGRRITHTPTHIGVQGQEQGLEQDLAVCQVWQRHTLQAEVFRHRRPLRTGYQDDALVKGHGLSHQRGSFISVIEFSGIGCRQLLQY